MISHSHYAELHTHDKVSLLEALNLGINYHYTLETTDGTKVISKTTNPYLCNSYWMLRYPSANCMHNARETFKIILLF